MSTEDPAAYKQKLQALRDRKSTAGAVKGIEIAGHVGAGAIIGGKAISIAYAAHSVGAPIMPALRCFAGRIFMPLAGALAGSVVAKWVGADDKLLDMMGRERQASKGRAVARVGHSIAHNHAFRGFFTGLLVGVAVGFAAALILGTGGLLAPVVIGLAAGFAGGFAGFAVAGMEEKSADVTGKIITGSPDVFFEKKKAARVTDKVSCNRHSSDPTIMEGSKTITINNFPLARIGHKITCAAVIQEGCDTIFADIIDPEHPDASDVMFGTPDAEYSKGEQALISGIEVVGALSAVREKGLLSGVLRWLFGEPIDAATGDYASYQTDFEYPGTPPLQLARVYPGKERVEGLLGTKWICSWSQRLVYDVAKRTTTFEDAEGQRLVFDLGKTLEFDSRHLKAPYYHLTGTKGIAKLFDSRTQTFLIFSTSETGPYTGVLSAIEDRNGNRIEFIYASGRLSRVICPDGAAFSVRTTSQGYIETITREGEANPLVSYDYDSSGAMIDVNSLFIGELHYGYTEQGRLNHWNDSGATSVDIEYDAQGRVIATRTPDGMFNDRFIYHPEERRTEYIDATGACTTIWFNENNLPIRELDPLGNTTLHEWDRMERKLSTTDALGRVTSYDYDIDGLLTSETDWAGRTISLAYDKHGQPTQIDYPDGTKSSWEYDDHGNLISATSPDGVTSHFSYDERGKLLRKIGPDGATSQLEYTAQGRLAALQDPLGNRTTFRQDSWKRPSEITDPAGHTTRYEYDITPDNPRADLSRIINPDGGEERFAYDKEGMLASHIAGEGQTTRYQHGAFDLLRSVIDPKGHGTQLEYDGAARLKQITNAQGQKWTYSYDLAGRLIHETDWAGRRTTYIRDAIGRVLTKRLPDGIEQHLNWDELDRIAAVDTEKQRITYEYDNSDRLIRAATWSRTNTEPESDLQFCYDDKGRLEKEIQNGITIEYKYDTNGRCISRTSPTGETTFSFDLMGQFTGMNSNGHTLNFTRDNCGLETERKYQELRTGDLEPGKTGLDAFALKQSYDPCGRLTSQQAGQPRQAAAHERLAEISRKYSWDKSGRLVGLKDNKRGTSNYRYDVRDQVERIKRITGLNKQTEEQFGYDSLMNLAFSKGEQHKYENGTVRTIGNSSYRYDILGRLKEKRVVKNGFRPKTWHYSWDDFDRLIETHTPDGAVWRYSYDAFGRRIKKECTKAGEFTKQQATSFIWQGATLAEEHSTAGNKSETTRWHFEPGTFNPLAKEANGNFYPIVTDHLGTPKELFDTDGNCVWQAEHELWGRSEVAFAKKTDNYQPLVDCNLRFQNQWEDKETGLYYNLNRYYDPDSGQYLSTDPIKLAGGLRTQGYVRNPLQWVDPMGLAPVCPKTLIDGKVTQVNKQHLPASIEKTFSSGNYKTVVTNEDIELYRVFGGSADAGGAMATTLPASNRIQTKIDSALLPEWGNSRMYEATIAVPKGETLNIGKVASQTIKSTGTVLNGEADQILLPQNWPLQWIKNIRVVPSK